MSQQQQGPIIPPTHGLTPAAREALAKTGTLPSGGVTDSDDDEFFGAPQFDAPSGLFSDGDSIPTTSVPPPAPPEKQAAKRAGSRIAARTRRAAKPDDDEKSPRDAKAGPPTLEEWTTFFSKIVLKLITEYYITLAFRGVDEDLVSERDLERLGMSDDERKLIAVPFAELSNRSKIMRRHGRAIVASGDAFNAIVVIGMWVARVNRIAAKYKPRQAKAKVKVNANGSSGQAQANGTATYAEGANGGRIYSDFPIFPGPG